MVQKGRQLRIETLEVRQMLTVYAHSAADDFAADFSGGLPQNNPNGDWAYLATDDTTTSLTATDGTNPINTFGIGAGWAQAGGVPSYARGGPLGLPTGTIAGHGPQKVIWTAPGDVDLGAVQLSGELTQLSGQPTRQTQFRIYKNSNTQPFLLIQADPNNQVAIPLAPSVVAVDPGATLTIEVDGMGSQGDGISTFSAWDLDILEVDPQIDADFNGDFAVNGSDAVIWEANYGTASGATQATGDADGDGDVDGFDFLILQGQLGNQILSGNETAGPPYNPTAVIVQTSGVTLPDGTALDITGTQTQGLQEAFDYAADEGWGVFVLPGTYTLSDHLDVVERQGASFRLQDVTMNFGAGVTDYGLQFDSTMITDWYWDGGALNAPNAIDGVRIEPRNFHPLDGCLGLTPPASVDSRFIFDVAITAATNEVTMDTTTRTINDNYFHFQGLTKNDINIVGSGFADTNTFVPARTDQAIPWDLFSTAGRVTVTVPNGPIGTVAIVYAPDGSVVDTTGTTTSGLQEAFDYAAANNLDVLVFGRGIVNSEIDIGQPHCGNTNLGLYNLNDTLTIGSLNGRTYRIFNVTFNYTGSGTAMVLNDMVNSDFELTGQLVHPASTSNSIGVQIKPLTTAFTGNKIRIEHVPSGNDTTGSKGVQIDASLQTIENSEFYFTEVLGSDFGIVVENPSASTFFRNNLLSSIHVHDWKTMGLRLGTNTAITNDNIHTNTVDIFTNTDGGPANTSLQVWGDNNTIRFGSYGGGQTGAASRLEPDSADNVVTWFAANGALVDLGTNNSYIAALVAASSSGGGGSVSSESLASLAGIQLSTAADQAQSSLVSESEEVDPALSVDPLVSPLDTAGEESAVRDTALAELSADVGSANRSIEDEVSESLAINLATPV